MKTLPLFIGLLLLAAGVQAQTSKAPDPASWKRYTVKNEDFSVALPTLPAMISNKNFSTRLNKERRERMISTSVDGVTYSIFAYENPQPRQSLDNFYREHTGTGQEPARELTINGFPGREYTYKQDGKPATEQYFATEENLYRFLAHGAPADDPGVKQFFSSITLGKKQQGIQITDGIGEPLETATAREKVFTGREVDKKVKLKNSPPPDHPDVAQGQVRGTVILKAVFTSDGRVTNIHVVQGLSRGVTEKAIEAAKKIRFIPAMKDGRFVSMWMQLEYHFDQ